MSKTELEAIQKQDNIEIVHLCLLKLSSIRSICSRTKQKELWEKIGKVQRGLKRVLDDLVIKEVGDNMKN